MSHTNSPAELLRSALVAAAVGADPESGPNPTWPVFVSHLPSNPDNAICVYDTSGKRDGRIMTGPSISKPGWQVRIRAVDYRTAAGKMKEIQRALDAISQFALTLDGDSYVIEAVTQTGTPLSLGQEPDASRRDGITLNGTVTYKEIMP